MADSKENYSSDLGSERVNPFTPKSDQDRISQLNDKKKGKYQIGDK